MIIFVPVTPFADLPKEVELSKVTLDSSTGPIDPIVRTSSTILNQLGNPFEGRKASSRDVGTVDPSLASTTQFSKPLGSLSEGPGSRETMELLAHKRSHSDSKDVTNEPPGKKIRENNTVFGRHSQPNIHRHPPSSTPGEPEGVRTSSPPSRSSYRIITPGMAETFSHVQIAPGQALKEEPKPSSPINAAAKSPSNQFLTVKPTDDHPQPPSSIGNHKCKASDTLSAVEIVEEAEDVGDAMLMENETIIVTEEDQQKDEEEDAEDGKDDGMEDQMEDGKEA